MENTDPLVNIYDLLEPCAVVAEIIADQCARASA